MAKEVINAKYGVKDEKDVAILDAKVNQLMQTSVQRMTLVTRWLI